MPRLLISLDMNEKQVVVVGGGTVAARKCLQLVRNQAHVTVIAPMLAPSMGRLVISGLVRHKARSFEPGDLSGAFLVYAATDDADVNRRVTEEARENGLLVNSADDPSSSSFSSTAQVRRGGLTLAVATDGASPALARRIRRDLAKAYGREYAQAVRLMGAVREKLLTQTPNRTYNKQIFNALAASDIPELFRKGQLAEIDRFLLGQCGPGFSLSDLGLLKEVSQ